MKLPRRQFLHFAAGVAALPALSRIAWAQAYPMRPVRLIVVAPAGGGFDIVARLMGQWLSERLGQPFVIENRPGAGSNIATEAVVRALPDGYTLLLVTAVNAISTSLYERLSFNLSRDIAPVAGITRVHDVMVANLSGPSRTVPEFIAHAKANPGKLTTLIVSDVQQNTPAAHSSGRSCVQLVNLPISPRIWLHVLSWCRYQASIWGIPNYTREEMNIRDLQEQMGEMGEDHNPVDVKDRSYDTHRPHGLSGALRRKRRLRTGRTCSVAKPRRARRHPQPLHSRHEAGRVTRGERRYSATHHGDRRQGLARLHVGAQRF